MAEWSWIQMRWPGRDIEDAVLRMEGCKLNVVRREGNDRLAWLLEAGSWEEDGQVAN